MENNSLDTRVLGQLLLMQSVMINLPDPVSIFSFVCNGLQDIPGIAKVRYKESKSETQDDLAGQRTFPVFHGDTDFGEIIIDIIDSVLFDPYEAYMHNFIFMVGVILNERKQKQLIELNKGILEQRIQERTQQLNTEKENLIESQRRYADLMEHVKLISVMLDSEGNVTFCNNFLLALSGYSYDEMIGANWFDLMIPKSIPELKLMFLEGIKTGKIADHYENQIHTKEGKLLDISWSNTILRNPKGNVTGMASIGENITVRKDAETKSLEYANQINSILESISDAFVALDTNWCYTYMNKQAGEIFNRKPEELIGKHIWTEFPESVGQLFYHAYYKAVETQKFQFLEEYYPPYDLWFENRIYPSEKGLSIFFHEITDRKKAEKQLKESELKFRTYVEQAADPLFVNDFSGQIIDVNQNTCDNLGYSREELLTMNVMDLEIGFDLKKAQEFWSQIIPGKTYHIQGRQKRKDGSDFPVEGSLGCYDKEGKRYYLSLARDISERKLAEEVLLNEKNLLSAIIENIPVMLTRYDPKSKMLYLNKSFEDKIGWNSKDLETINLMEEVYPDPEYRQEALDYMLEASSEWKEFQVHSRSGDLIDSEWCNLQLDDGTQIGIGIDITKEKQIAAEILKANQELKIINRIIHTSSNTLDLNDLLENILDQALEIVGFEGGTICMIEPDNTLKLASHRETSDETIADLTQNRIKVGDCLCGNCANDGCPLILRNRSAVLEYASREALRHEIINFHAAFPFISKGVSLGVLCVFTRTDKKPEDRNMKLLETLTKEVALAIENALLFQEMEQRVVERTSELELANKDLEEINDLFVGREFRIIELKEEIERLNNSFSQ